MVECEIEVFEVISSNLIPNTYGEGGMLLLDISK